MEHILSINNVFSEIIVIMLLIFHLALPLHLSLLRYLEADEDESNEDEEIIEELSDDDVVNDEDQEEEEVLDEDYEEITNELDPNFKGEIWLPLCMLKKMFYCLF